LPQTWSMDYDQDLQGEIYEDAELRVDRPNPVYADAPYTVRGAECGDPGSHIHFTPGFLTNSTKGVYGNVGKVLVHEWAKLRWGVYEEHGYPGDKQFPMFFYKTIYTASGERQVLSYNFCANEKIYGYEQDVKTGGQCTRDADNLPDQNCMYYVSQQTSASSSYMALPYISSVQNFCDNTEENIHDTHLPTKQNLFCNGRSTWEVILESPDFANNTNLPIAGPAPPPKFTLVGSKLSSVNFVLVMDVSLSMQIGDPNDPVNTNGFRINAMVDAAKRWVKFDVPEGVKLGMVTFSDEENLRPFQDLIEINDASRDTLVDKLNGVFDLVEGKTCIGCALEMAAKYPTLLNNTLGGNILLITDGHQQCKDESTCTKVSEMIDLYVERNHRVVTIAMGPDADPEIEELAEKTGGKSYYVEDNGSTGTIDDAFGGSSTYQPGDTIGNTDIDVYQKDWDFDADRIKDTFDIDASIGRDLTFKLDVSREKATDECVEDIKIKFQIPGPTPTMKEEVFKCSKNNFGVFKKDMSDYQNPVPEGRWVYIIEKGSEKVSISVKVTAKAKDQSTDPILTKCWIATGSQAINSEMDLKLSVVADVRQGNKPVIGAKVKAIVERPSDASGNPYPEMEIELADNGAGADFIKNDGLYARFFTHYTGKGRYNVKCQVVGDDDTKVNEGFINNREGRTIPMAPGGTPMCCGSDTITPDSVLTKSGNFTRSAAGGAFQITVDITGNDITPPGKTNDLNAKFEDSSLKITFTSPGNDLDSQEPVARYIIKFSAENITAENFDKIGTEILEDDLNEGFTLTPVNGSLPVELSLMSGMFVEDTPYTLAMKAVDEANNTSPVSNIKQIFLQSAAPGVYLSLVFIIFNVFASLAF